VTSDYDYESLMEDLYDLAAIAERRDETTISFDEVKRRLENEDELAENDHVP